MAALNSTTSSRRSSAVRSVSSVTPRACFLRSRISSNGSISVLDSRLEPEHDVAVHGDEAAVAVVREARVAGQCDHALDGDVVEAEVQHGVHHARHRRAGAGADRHEQRPGGIAEAAADNLFDAGEVPLHFGTQRRRVATAVLVVVGAHLGLDVKPGGTGRPRPAISARLAPLPPSSSFIPALPSAVPPPKAYTNFAAREPVRPPCARSSPCGAGPPSLPHAAPAASLRRGAAPRPRLRDLRVRRLRFRGLHLQQPSRASPLWSWPSP